ncbi:hypothetical protein GCM10010970_07860 [Silvimonas iriomotensis]|uniref:TraB/GumN family protein n=2 Tax=Silvimonas iriomotensis TaxID=449662 RepID=A0ABQ2P5V7_9NEIS|nr:hypothetical protein GCM10010970_07860 [Silvimonas iriomotensis]
MFKAVGDALRTPGKIAVENELDSAHLAKLKAQLVARKIDPGMTGTLASWATNVVLMYAPDTRPTHIIDMQIATEAVADKKQYAGLESVQTALAVFQGVPEPRQILMLKDLLDHPRGPDTQEPLAARYFTDTLPAGFLQQLTDYPSTLPPQDLAWFKDYYYRVLLDQRTAGFYRGLDQPLQHGGCFVAVGIGHLAGEHGLIALLRHAGYQVTPQSLN